MSKRLDENLGSVGYDGLIVAPTEPVADVGSPLHHAGQRQATARSHL